MRTIIALLVASLAAAAPAQILTTEVWVGDLDFKDGRFAVSNLVNVSNDHPGYDNQPSFFPDGTIVYTTQAGEMEDSGLTVHAVLWKNGVATPLPDARGFSPTPTPDGKQLMLLRQGRVWLHDLSGKEIRGLTETTEAGYFSRFDDRNWVLFMNDKERRIVIHDVKTKALDTMAVNAITAPYRIPGKNAVTFVGDGRVLQRLDVKERRVTTLATIPFKTGGHHVWTSRGTILIASGNTIYEWNPAHPEEWKKVWTFDHPDLQGITRIALNANADRIALNANADRIALVSTPRAATIIRDARAESNRLLALHRMDTFLFAKDGLVVASSGKRFEGSEAREKALGEQFAQHADLVYVRTPTSITVGKSGDVASERGTWTGRSSTLNVGGEYIAVWRREIAENGTPSWTIQSVVFAPLE